MTDVLTCSRRSSFDLALSQMLNFNWLVVARQNVLGTFGIASIDNLLSGKKGIHSTVDYQVSTFAYRL